MSVVRTFSGPWLRAKSPLCVLLLLPVELCLATTKLYLPETAVSDRMTASSRRKFLSGWARITHSIPAGGGTVISIVLFVSSLRRWRQRRDANFNTSSTLSFFDTTLRLSANSSKHLESDHDTYVTVWTAEKSRNSLPQRIPPFSPERCFVSTCRPSQISSTVERF